MTLNWWSVLWKNIFWDSCYCQWPYAGSRRTKYSTWSSWWKRYCQVAQIQSGRGTLPDCQWCCRRLAAAFNAPIAGLLFVVEEVYHHFSRFFLGLNSSSQSRSKLCLTTHIWPNTRTRYARQHSSHDPRPVLDIPPYGSFFLRLSGFSMRKLYSMLVEFMTGLVKKIHLDKAYYPILAFILIIPVGIFLPQILGGGNQLVLSLTEQDFSFQVLLAYFFDPLCLEYD